MLSIDLKARTLLMPLLLFLSVQGLAQIDLSQFYDQSFIPFLNRSKPLKVDVKWDMDGKSQVFLNEGLNYLEEGNFNLSLSNIDSFLVRNYKAWVGHYYRGQVLMRMGEFRGAEVEFLNVTKLNSSSLEGYIELSEAYEYQHQFKKAKDQLLKAIDINPNYVYAYYKLGNLALKSLQIDEAMTYYKKCNKIDPKFPDSYMARGIISYHKEGKADEAIALMNSSLLADSTFASAYYWRGLLFLEKNEKKKCLEDWSHFLSFNPRNQFVKILRAFVNTELGNYEDAFSDFRKVFQNTAVNEDRFQAGQTTLDKKIDLQFAANYLIKKGYGMREEAFINLKAGFCLMTLGKDRQAMDYLRKAERMTSSPAVYLLIAIALEHGGVHNQAFRYYSKTLEYDNDVFDAHKKLCVYLIELKEWSLATHHINELLRLQPNTPSAIRLRGFMKAAQKNYEESIVDLTAFIKTDSTDVEALRNRALCYSLTQQPQKASLDYSRILKLSPQQEFLGKMIDDALSFKDTLNAVFLLKEYYQKFNTINSLIELSEILIAQKKYVEVAKEINETKEKITALEKGNNQIVYRDYSNIKSEISLLEGMLAYHQSLYNEAISQFTQSLKKNPKNKEAKYLRGKCYVKVSNVKKAMEDFKELKDEKYKDAEQLLATIEK